MIEARYWRSGLRKDLAWLRRARSFRRWSGKREGRYERRVILVGAQIHVLLAHAELPPRLASQPFGCVRYPATGPGELPRSLDRGEVPARFDLDAPASDALAAGDLCHRVLHHALLAAVSRKPRRFTHLWIVSGEGGRAALHELEMEALLEYFGRFARDEGRPGTPPAPRKGARRRRGEAGPPPQGPG